MSVQIPVLANQVQKQAKGYQAISLDSLVSTGAITIKAGSEIECAGSLYEFQADEVESGGTWAAIANSSAVYVYVVPSGGTATFIYSTTVPTWDTAKQGLYASGINRAVISLYKDSGGLYQAKKILPASQDLALQGVVNVPIGAIVAWHKSFTNTPALSAGFVECNGQVLADPQSPYNGQTIPNLNGLGHFLRGAATSGTVQAAGTARPTTPFTGTGTFTGNSSTGSIVNLSETTAGAPAALPGVNVTINGGGDAETRPVNMSVVWVIRVK